MLDCISLKTFSLFNRGKSDCFNSTAPLYVQGYMICQEQLNMFDLQVDHVRYLYEYFEMLMYKESSVRVDFMLPVGAYFLKPCCLNLS